jgi:hypothetical protein
MNFFFLNNNSLINDHEVEVSYSSFIGVAFNIHLRKTIPKSQIGQNTNTSMTTENVKLQLKIRVCFEKNHEKQNLPI